MADTKAYIQMLEAKAKAAEARVAELEAKAASSNRITVRVGQSGTVSVYGLQRFPVSLHPEQWDRLLTPAVVAEIGKLTLMARKDEAGFGKLAAEAKARAEARK